MPIERNFATKAEMDNYVVCQKFTTRGFTPAAETHNDGRAYTVLSSKEPKFRTAFKIALFAILSIFKKAYKDLFVEAKAIWNDKTIVYKLSYLEEPKKRESETEQRQCSGTSGPSRRASNPSGCFTIPVELMSPAPMSSPRTAAKSSVISDATVEITAVEPSVETAVGPTTEAPQNLITTAIRNYQAALAEFDRTSTQIEPAPVIGPMNEPATGPSLVVGGFSPVGLKVSDDDLNDFGVAGLRKYVEPQTRVVQKPAVLVAGLKKTTLRQSAEVMVAFAMDSSKVNKFHAMKKRNEFMAAGVARPVVLSKSEFVPDSMVEHLMRDKRDSAIGVKYIHDSAITNMEGAMHTFLTPIASVEISGDYAWKNNYHGLQQVDGVRDVVLSAAIHPDFEKGGKSEVVMKLIEVKDEALEGKVLADDFQPTKFLETCFASSEDYKAQLAAYDAKLQQHMVYHLTAAHKLPALHEIGAPKTEKEALERLEELICSDNFHPIMLKHEFAKLNGHVISLEAFFNIYHHQIRNEFSALEALLPQGYVYTIDPPSIFAAQLGGAGNVAILNRLQTLALKYVNANTPLNNLKRIGFNNFADPKNLEHLNNVFPGKGVPKAQLFQNSLNYSGEKGLALVIHNNSDAFGQNIETEGPTSMDGIIGVYSDAALQLKRDREDLGKYVI